MKNLNRNVAIFYIKTFNMSITWLIFLDFGMIIVVLRQRNQFN